MVWSLDSNRSFRGNIGNALTDSMMTDLHINQETVNTGTSLVFVGICIGDIPANLAIQKVVNVYHSSVEYVLIFI